jgi:hypothetical protein
MPDSHSSSDEHDSKAAPEGPSWGLMLFVILLAMLVAVAIAWAFIHPMLHRH